MKYTLRLAAAMLCTAMMVASCDDTSNTIGSSLVEDKVEIVMDSSFVLVGHSVLNPNVQSRTTTQLLGRIQARGFGDLESEIVTQFMPGVSLDVTKFSVDEIDSIKLIMQMPKGSFTGDSIMPMGLTVYPLTAALPSPIYSDFDPTGYYDPQVVWGSTIYTATALGQSDSIVNLARRSIEVTLPRKFAEDMYNQYKTSPTTFQTPQSFAQWFPGLYIANSFGNGRVTGFDRSYITMYYHVHDKSESTGNDTTYYRTNTFLAVTPEIITNNDIRLGLSSALTDRVAAGETLVVAPTGYDIEIDFPAQEIIDYYKRNSGAVALLNALTMEIPVEEIANDYGIAPPANVLLVKSSQLDNFFAKNLINDGVNSFYATYDASRRTYVFTEMRGYITDLLAKDKITADDTRFTITPVTINTEKMAGSYNQTTTAITGIVPYVSTPVMARLKIGEAKIKFTFSKQTVVL